MRVMCINDKGWFYTGKKYETTSYFFGLKKVTREVNNPTSGPAFGEECVVLNSDRDDTGLYYWLEKYSHIGRYISHLFVPIAENENEEEEKIKINELTQAK